MGIPRNRSPQSDSGRARGNIRPRRNPAARAILGSSDKEDPMPTANFVAPDLTPYMRYRDAPAAIEWLIRAFGFEKVVVYEGKGGTIAHAVLRFGTGAIQL